LKNPDAMLAFAQIDAGSGITGSANEQGPPDVPHSVTRKATRVEGK
jgi:hypothetical protein